MNTIDPHIAISTKDLTIGYLNKKERISIAKDVNFSLEQGELAAIVGINGIGKSTLLRTIGRVQPKLSGEILLDGKELESYDPLALASKISVVLTEPIASKNLTVLELISLGRQPYTNWIGTLTSLDKEKIVRAINMVQIEDLQHKKCYELSDGQLQKVMIARALAQDTNIMLLDEPTSHLDLYHKVHILKLLREIAHETKKTILFTTHEIEIAIQLCDKMLIMQKERSSFGEPCELITNKSFENLFPSDTITFDSQSGSFKVKK
ncbi:ABC transporter ATP-binding protein [Sediminicola sp. YIK13]|uniref:ABC transporter ATP-binding protein n=1 Tax=Sediminicola sp. YIK13 TaxID=1453352 RepID=UPI0007226E4A|nr:ABC transporter ATP-binding protein [Sediminicola sp. YIK13]ALM07363.1 ABC transporter ATP-binding protein [Sediminicola sp. YIK13]